MIVLLAGSAAASDTGAPVASSGDTAPASRRQGMADDEHPLNTEFTKLIELQDRIRMLLRTQPAVQEEPEEQASPDQQAAQAEPLEQVQPVSLRHAADMLYRVGRYDQALNLYKQSLPNDTEEQIWLSFQTANCKRHLGRLNNAMSTYQEIITKHPDSCWADEAEWWIDNIQWKMTLQER